jgi:hypothetical protein
MKETEPGKNLRTERIKKEFNLKIKELVSNLEFYKSDLESGFVYTYGDLSASTSKGLPLVVHTIRHCHPLPKTKINETIRKAEPEVDKINERRDKITLIAKDTTTNKIVGLRFIYITNKGTSDKDNPLIQNYRANGDITVLRRNEGIGMALDKTYEKVLQRIINEEQTKETVSVIQKQLVW